MKFPSLPEKYGKLPEPKPQDPEVELRFEAWERSLEMQRALREDEKRKREA